MAYSKLESKESKSRLQRFCSAAAVSVEAKTFPKISLNNRNFCESQFNGFARRPIAAELKMGLAQGKNTKFSAHEVDMGVAGIRMDTSKIKQRLQEWCENKNDDAKELLILGSFTQSTNPTSLRSR